MNKNWVEPGLKVGYSTGVEPTFGWPYEKGVRNTGNRCIRNAGNRSIRITGNGALRLCIQFCVVGTANEPNTFANFTYQDFLSRLNKCDWICKNRT